MLSAVSRGRSRGVGSATAEGGGVVCACGMSSEEEDGCRYPEDG